MQKHSPESEICENNKHSVSERLNELFYTTILGFLLRGFFNIDYRKKIGKKFNNYRL